VVGHQYAGILRPESIEKGRVTLLLCRRPGGKKKEGGKEGGGLRITSSDRQRGCRKDRHLLTITTACAGKEEKKELPFTAAMYEEGRQRRKRVIGANAVY